MMGTQATLSADGVHTLTYRSIDALGNVETPRTATVKVERLPPTTTDDVDDAAWHDGVVTVTLTPDDGAGSA